MLWQKIASRTIATIGSSRLALLLLTLITAICLAGALLPQEVRTDQDTLIYWQDRHPAITALAEPLKLFSAFRSPVFLSVCLMLASNTLCCAATHIVSLRQDCAFKGFAGLRAWGFTIMHLGIIGIFVAGCMSVWLGMDGRLIATEGYPVAEEHDNFRVLREGSLRRERHSGIVLQLNEVTERYEDDNLVHRSARITIGQSDAQDETVIEVNRPLSRDGVFFTFDRAGYVPRIRVYDLAQRSELLRADVTFSISDEGGEVRHRDILPLDLPLERGHRMAATLFPMVENGEDASILVAILEDLDGNQIGQADISVGKNGKIGAYRIDFLETRRWAAFRVMADPGYPVAVFFLWLSLFGLVLRYLPDFINWPENVESGRQGL